MQIANIIRKKHDIPYMIEMCVGYKDIIYLQLVLQ